jgi:hypothetical protein
MAHLTIPDTSLSLVEADKLRGEIFYSLPVANLNHMQQKVTEWVGRQGKHWPTALTADFLMQNAQLVHLPYWVLSGRATGQWSAQIGREGTQEFKCNACNGTGVYYLLTGGSQICTDCGGKGRQIRRVTNWTSQGGLCETSFDHEICENFEKGLRGLFHCGKPATKVARLPSPKPNSLLFTPQEYSEIQGLLHVERMIEKGIARSGDRQASGLGDSVRSLKTVVLSVQAGQAFHWLYPMYVGSYRYEEKTYIVAMDALTGVAHVDTPSSVRNARLQELARRGWPWVAGLAIVLMAVFLFVNNQNRTQQAASSIRQRTSQAMAKTPEQRSNTSVAVAYPQFEGTGIAIKIEQGGCRIYPQIEFQTTDSIYIASHVRNVRQNDTFKAVWFHENKLAHSSEEMVFDSDFDTVCVWFSINPKTTNLLAGKWMAKIILNDQITTPLMPFQVISKQASIARRVTQTPPPPTKTATRPKSTPVVTPKLISATFSQMKSIGGTWKISPSGQVSGEVNDGDGLMLFAPRYGDFIFSADIQTSDRESSFALRMQNSKNGYVVVVAPTNARGANPGVYLIRRVNGNETIIASTNRVLHKRGDWVKLTVTVTGDKFLIQLGDHLSFSGRDARFSKGLVGFRIYGDQRRPCKAAFRNVTLTPQ